MRLLLLFIILAAHVNPTTAQNKFVDPLYKGQPIQKTKKNYVLNIEAAKIFQQNVSPSAKSSQISSFSPKKLDPTIIKHKLSPSFDKNTGEIIALSGIIPEIKKYSTHEERCIKYLQQVAKIYGISNPTKDFVAIESSADNKNRIHTKLDQHHKGVKVHGGELSIHEVNGDIYMVQGRTKKFSEDLNVDPSISFDQVTTLAKEKVENFAPISNSLKSLFQHDQVSAKLMIYNKSGKSKLVWDVDIYPNIMERVSLFIDAHNGEIIEEFKTICKVHNHEEFAIMDGKVNSSAVDLFGNRSSVNIFQCGTEYFLVDASRAMFKGTPTSCADADRLLDGVIVTLNAGNRSPANRNFDYEISGSRVVDSWADASAISAHINGGRAYEYFKNTFGRESITGNGTNIVSFVNVSEDDGSRMDNAFWNGEFIFYGNGNQAFSEPLAKALDVAGHEMSHGVIQTTANLEYRNESGALNEHFADVFGVLIEREDFRIGEDVANPQIFPGGAIRSMQDPNNGGNKLGDPGYQPAHVSEQFFGTEDNGGVHINSGIPNLAFFTFVTDESFGADINERAAIGEQIWYKALTQYLRSTANFSDLRIATRQAAMEDYGQVVATAIEVAFDHVGITGTNVTEEIEELPSNPGDEYVVWSDIDFNTINISTSAGEDFGVVSQTPHISRPSATDNGQFVIFVNSSKQIQAVEIDWSLPEIKRDFLVSESRIYRNAVISRDGSKIAALTGDIANGDFDNSLIVFDLIGQSNREYELFNPTFSEGNVSTDGVLYADVLEFDLTGENIIYDAFNQLSGTLGQDLSYWDIGIINVWDNVDNRFTLGNIFKLFSGLPEDVSIGNPTFSKNSPNIIAFDFIETTESTGENNYSILGYDRENGHIGTIYENNTLGYPSYSLKDNQIIFSVTNNGSEILAITELNENKISASDNAFVFIENAEWGVYIGNGERNLSTATKEEIKIDQDLNIYPNPTSDKIFVTANDSSISDAKLTLFDLQGKRIKEKKIMKSGEMDMSNIYPGTYILMYTNGKSNVFRKIVKL